MSINNSSTNCSPNSFLIFQEDALPEIMFINCNLNPKPNSALSSKSEFDHAGPLPSLFLSMVLLEDYRHKLMNILLHLQQ
jgi:hypothetical protein